MSTTGTTSTDHGGPEHPPDGRRPTDVRVVAVWRAGLATWWRYKGIVIALGILVFLPAAAIEDLADEALRHLDQSGSWVVTLFLAGLGATAATSQLLGLTFYSGLTDHLVGTHQHGHAGHTIGRLLRTLPYGRLIGTQILMAVVVILGFAALIVPGFILFTLFCISGPVVIIEGRRPLGALRRSAELIRPVFWTALIAITGAVLVESYAEDLLHLAHLPHLGELAGETLFTAVVGSMVGIVEATLAHELLARDRDGVDARAER